MRSHFLLIFLLMNWNEIFMKSLYAMRVIAVYGATWKTGDRIDIVAESMKTRHAHAHACTHTRSSPHLNANGGNATQGDWHTCTQFCRKCCVFESWIELSLFVRQDHFSAAYIQLCGDTLLTNSIHARDLFFATLVVSSRLFSPPVRVYPRVSVFSRTPISLCVYVHARLPLRSVWWIVMCLCVWNSDELSDERQKWKYYLLYGILRHIILFSACSFLCVLERTTMSARPWCILCALPVELRIRTRASAHSHTHNDELIKVRPSVMETVNKS